MADYNKSTECRFDLNCSGITFINKFEVFSFQLLCACIPTVYQSVLSLEK